MFHFSSLLSLHENLSVQAENVAARAAPSETATLKEATVEIILWPPIK